MFAIAFDMTVKALADNHPTGISAAYSEIGAVLARFGFTRVQGSVYLTQTDDLANLFSAITALKALPWFPACVRDIRAFKVEHWSDFTAIVKG